MADQQTVYVEDPDDCRSESFNSDIEFLDSPGSLQRRGPSQGALAAAQHDTLDVEMKQTVQKVGEYQLQLMLKNKDLEQGTVEIQKLKGENEALKQKNEERTQELNETKMKLAVMQTKYDMASEEIGKFKEKKGKSKKIKEDLVQSQLTEARAQERLEATEKHAKSLIDEKEKRDKKSEELYGQTQEDMANRIQKLDADLSKCQVDLAEAKEEAVKAIAQLEGRSEMYRILKEDYSKLELKCNNLEEENAELNKSAHSHEMKSATLGVQQNTSTEREQNLLAQIGKLTDENSKQSDKFAEVNSELNKVKGELASSTMLLNQKISELRSENGELKQTINDQRRTLHEKVTHPHSLDLA